MHGEHAPLRRIALALCISLALLPAARLGTARADGGASAVATALAAAEIGVKVIGGLATWVADQSDDCAAAASAGVKGCECGFQKEECQDTGWTSARTEACDGSDPRVENECGWAVGSGYAFENIYGSWSGKTTNAWAVAYAAPSECGENFAYAWATASVDGTAKTVDDGDVSRPEGGEPKPALFVSRDAAPARGQAGDSDPTTTTWPDGTILAYVDLSGIELVTPVSAPTACFADGSLTVDGTELFGFSVSLDKNGNLSTSGSVTAADFDVAYSRADENWEATYIGANLEFPLGVQGATPQYFDLSFDSNSTTDPASMNQGLTEYEPAVDCCKEIEIREHIPTEHDNAVEFEASGLTELRSLPNPFTATTEIGFSLQAAAPVSLGIYDVAGRQVALLLDRELGAGGHQVTWDGTTAGGTEAQAGVYYAVLRASGERQLRRLVLTR